jgi:1,2-diacylglycerol 3-alpha-glucosyltransferase
MNIGIFTNTYKPLINGVVNCVALIRHELIRKGHRVFIFAPTVHGYTDDEEGVYRYPSLSLTKKVNYPLAIPFSSAISKIIPTLSLDIIHSQHPFLLGVTGADWARRLGIPLVFTFHTQYEQYAHYIPLPGGIVKSLSRMLVRSYTDRCTLIITPGKSILELLHSYGITDKVVFMPNAIELSNFQGNGGPNIRERFGLEEGEALLLYVGRMAQEKNLPFMLEAFKRIRETQKARLMIIGEGSMLQELKAKAKALGIGEQTIFTGRVEYKDIAPYYHAADLFIMTSTTEVKPLALLEAMASGLPIVAVSAHGSSDTIIHGQNGLLTDESLEGFAGAVGSLLDDRGRLDEMRKESLKTARDYSIDTITERLLALYEKISSGGSPVSSPAP